MPATSECPACGQAVSASAPNCKHCGAEFEPARPAKQPAKEMGDGAKYGIIIGVLAVIIAVILFFNTGMGGTQQCGDCKGRGSITCQNCKEGKPKCVMCKGSGRDPQTYSTCGRCNGRGEDNVCSKCQGNPKKTCPTCGGEGKFKR